MQCSLWKGHPTEAKASGSLEGDALAVHLAWQHTAVVPLMQEQGIY